LPAKPGVILKSAAMVLSMGLLHEEDLFSVFEGLRLSIKNLFAVDSCVLSRGSRIDQPLNSRKINLTATCVIQWVTINAK
jgi:hypothetical protein